MDVRYIFSVLLALLFLSGCLGSSEPARLDRPGNTAPTDFSPSPLPTPTLESTPSPTPSINPLPDTAPSPSPVASQNLQELLDGPDRIIDGGGRTFIEKNIYISTRHDGKELRNATVLFRGPSASTIGRWLFIQGKTYNGVVYPAGNIDFTFRNVKLDGGFTPPTEMQALNMYLADLVGEGINVITNITNATGHVTFIDVEISNTGNSAVAMSAKHFTFENFTATNCAMKGLGLRGTGGTLVEGKRITFRNCGSIDFHNDGDFFVEESPDVAVIEDFYVYNPTGRSKVAGNNWQISGTNWNFIKDRMDDCELEAGFDLARHPRLFHINGLTTTNFLTMGVRTGSDTVRTDGSIKFDNLRVTGSMRGVEIRQRLEITNSVFQDIRQRYVSGLPTLDLNNIDLSFLPDLFWAQKLDVVERRYDELNLQYGTNFQPSYFAPQAVIDLMETR